MQLQETKDICTTDILVSVAKKDPISVSIYDMQNPHRVAHFYHHHLLCPLAHGLCQFTKNCDNDKNSPSWSWSRGCLRTSYTTTVHSHHACISDGSCSTVKNAPLYPFWHHWMVQQWTVWISSQELDLWHSPRRPLFWQLPLVRSNGLLCLQSVSATTALQSWRHRARSFLTRHILLYISHAPSCTLSQTKLRNAWTNLWCTTAGKALMPHKHSGIIVC